MQQIVNGDAAHPIVFFLTSSSDHITGLTGASPTVTISKNGAAYAAPAGAVSQIGYGYYALTPAGADVTSNGVFLLHATATGADPCDVAAQVTAVNPYDAVHGGLSALPNVAAGAAGGLPLGTSTGNVNLDATYQAALITAIAAALPSVNTIWNEVGSGHTTAGSFAVMLTQALAAAVVAASESTTAAGFGAAPTAAANATAAANQIFAQSIESGINFLQAQRAQTGAAAGVLTGANTTNIGIAAAGNPGTPRIAATVDASGNRSAVALTL